MKEKTVKYAGNQVKEFIMEYGPVILAGTQNKYLEDILCKNEGGCDLFRPSRRNCTFCWFEMCQFEGMKYKPILETSGPMLVRDAPPTASQLQMREEIEYLYEAYKRGGFTEARMETIQRKDFEVTIHGTPELTRVECWKAYALELEKDLGKMLPFIQKLPQQFVIQDSLKLIRKSAFPIFLIRRFRALTVDGLLLYDGRFVKTATLGILYGNELAREMFRITYTIRKMELTDEDIAMFMPLIFCKPDNPANLQLENPGNLRRSKDKFKKLFREYASQFDDPEKKTGQFKEVWKKLIKINDMHEEQIKFLRPYRDQFPENSQFVDYYWTNELL